MLCLEALRKTAEPHTVHSAYELLAGIVPESLALVSAPKHGPTHTATYAELDQRSRSLAIGLQDELNSTPVGDSNTFCIALHVSRTHPDFLPTILATSRCNVPFVLMSVGLADIEMERQRNRFILQKMKVAIVLHDGVTPLDDELVSLLEGSSIKTVTISLLLCKNRRNISKFRQRCANEKDVFALMFTGGTKRTKIVKVTHSMILHERSKYPRILRWSSKDQARVLVNAPTYWPAATIGQLSLTLALGGCGIISDMVDALDVRRVILEQHINVFGAVPDVLALIAREPAIDLPDIHFVIAWAERLPRAIAERWRGHPKAILLELLISTEYWLTFYADPLGVEGSVARALEPDVEVRVLTEEGVQAKLGGIGEIYLRGPMVTPGYLDEHDNEGAFRMINGKRYFRTRDTVRIVDGGFVFHGRADMLTKEKGQWVDMGALEQELQDDSRIVEACIVPHPACPNDFCAFVVLEKSEELAHVVQHIRERLPWRTSLNVLRALPRHAATGKVDVRSLQKRWLSQESDKAWPISLQPQLERAPIALHSRLQRKVRRHMIWAVVVLHLICFGWNLKGIFSLVSRKTGTRKIRGWQSVPLAPLAMAYSWLATLYFTEVGSTASAFIQNFPFGRFGMLLVLHLLRSFNAGARHCLSALAVVGAALATRRQRFFSWPLVFWFGFGQQADMESGRWLKRATWLKECSLQLDRFEVALDEFHNYFQSILQKAYHVLTIRRHTKALSRKQAKDKYAPKCQDVATQWEEYPQDDQASIAQARQLAAYLGTIERDAVSWWSTDSSWQSTLKYSTSRTRPWWTLADSLQAWPEEDLDKASYNTTWAEGDWHGHNTIDSESNASVTTELASTHLTPDCSSNAEVEKGGPIEMADGANTDSTCSSMAGDGINRIEPALNTIEESVGQNYALKKEYDAYYYTWDPNYGNTSGTSFREDGHDSLGDNTKYEQYYQRWSSYDWSAANASGTYHTAYQGYQSTGGAATECTEGEKQYSSPEGTEKTTWEMKQWWWYNCTSSDIEFSEQAVSWASGSEEVASLRSSPQIEDHDLAPKARRLLQLIKRTQPHLSTINLDVALMGMDSLRVSILANAISAEFGVAISSKDIREAKSARHILERLEEAPSLSGNDSDTRKKQSDSEFAVWFTPGQFRPMGPWVMRCDRYVDSVAMSTAVAQLIVRHSALRAMIIDPQAFRSFMLNAAVMFTLIGTFLPARIRRLISAALCAAWPRIRVQRNAAPSKDLPFATIEVEDGQSDFEYRLSQRRWEFEKKPSFDVALFQLKLPIVGVWELQDGTCLSIFRHDEKLIYADLALKQTGKLTTPQEADWLKAPDGFPALYSSRLNDGSIVWLRWERAYDLRLVQKRRLTASEPWTYRSASRNPQIADQRETVAYLAIQSYHSFADGFCFAPLAGDLLDLYHAKVHEDVADLQLPQLGEPFEVLQRRLFDTLQFRLESPDRHSLRGSLWNFQGRGYSHTIGFDGGVVSSLKMAAARYGLPMNYLFLSLVVVAHARASDQEVVDLTLYVPMRDGYETGLVGLFADWRDITVVTSKEETSVLAVALQVADILRLRRWRVFNALRKAECTVVNFDSLDLRLHDGFAQLPRSLWDGGLTLGQKVTRSDQLDWLHQPLVFDLQEEGNQWWLYMRMAYHLYPPPWTRRFLRSIEDAAWDIVFHPLELVHKPIKNDF